MFVEIIINAGSGSVSDDAVEEIKRVFAEHHVNARIHSVGAGEDLAHAAKRAAAGDAAIVVAAGGDGTVSTVASVLAGTAKPLGVLPMGTLNNFSKDLKIPQDLASAVAVIAEKHIRSIDIGEVNGHFFVNNSSIGLYPRIVLQRERQQRLGHGKWWAAAWAAWRILRVSPWFRVTLLLDGRKVSRKTPFVFVGNNSYEMDFYNIGRRSRLDGGALSVYLLRGSGRKGLFSLVIRTLFGLLRQARDFEELQTEELTIDMRRRNVPVAADGEVSNMKTPLHYRIHRKALRVIVPKEE